MKYLVAVLILGGAITGCDSLSIDRLFSQKSETSNAEADAIKGTYRLTPSSFATSGDQVELIFGGNGKVYILDRSKSTSIEYNLMKISDAIIPPQGFTSVVPGIRRRQSEAQTYIGSMNRSQQAFYLEKQSFASQLADLAAGIDPETENYSYSILKPSDTYVQNTARAKRDELKSYIGITWIGKTTNGELSSFSVICESAAPSNQIPTVTDPGNGTTASCPPGYLALN